MVRTLPVVLVSALFVSGTPAWAANGHHAGGPGAPNATMNAPSSRMPMGGSEASMPRGGMMGGAGQPGMMPMMGMMTDHVEGRLAFLKTELRITPAQMPRWNAFAEAVRAGAKTVIGLHRAMMQVHQKALPMRIEANVKALAARLGAVKKVHAAIVPLYASFSEAQKHTADRPMVGPRGMIGMM
jgi:hypothetical protein